MEPYCKVLTYFCHFTLQLYYKVIYFCYVIIILVLKSFDFLEIELKSK